MANIIIVLILVALVGYGIYSYVHHLTHGGGCCGERDAAAKKVKVEDHNKAHYPHTLVMGVDGMTCQNCQRHVENALNVMARHLGRRGPGRPERHHSDQGRG